MNRIGQAGNTLIGVLVASGISMVTIAGVAAMVQMSMKAGKSAQGLSEAGLLTDSIRSIVSDSSRCQQAFRVTPAGGGAPVAPVLATDDASVSLSSIGMMSGGTFTPYATAGQSFGSISITGMTLTRTSQSLLTLQLAAAKSAQAVGGSALAIPPLLISASFDSSTGAITRCFFGGAGGASGNVGSIVKCRKNSSGTTAGIYSGHVMVTFGPSDCEGKTLDSSYVGTSATVNVCNGAIDWTIIDPTATSSPAIDFGSRGGNVCEWTDGKQYDISVVYISRIEE